MRALLRRFWDYLCLGWARLAYCDLLEYAIITRNEEARKFALEKLDELDKK